MITAARIGAAAAAAIAVVAVTGAGVAQAAPVGVQQVPATALISNGIADYGTYAAAIRISSAGPGKVTLSAPAGGRCGTPAIDGSFVRFTYTNVTNGRSGAGSVRPCPGPWSGSRTVTLSPGAGVVVGTISIVSRTAWAIPGGATFTVR